MGDDGRPERRQRTPPSSTFTPATTRGPAHVRAGLDQFAATLGLADIDSVDKLFLNWSEVVGAELSTRCRPLSLRHGTLTIRAVDRQWATELQWMTELILRRCADALRADVVDQVVIRT